MFQILRENQLPAILSVIQVGASAGQEVPIFRTEGIQAGLFIEPIDDVFELLCSACSKFESYTPLKSIVCSVDGLECDFYLASNSGMSSSIYAPGEHLLSYPTIGFRPPVKVKGYTLDTLVKRVRSVSTGLPETFDLIYIDVQGAELDVFKGATEALYHSRYIYTEIGSGGGYVGESRFESLISFLNHHNFRLLALEFSAVTGYGNAFFFNTRTAIIIR